jgi:cytoskeletal protein CcmA (bactofilin family)
LNIRGKISGDAALIFEGTLDGPIHLRDADLIIGPRGVVRGAIEAREIQIEGTVEGEVTADVRILLLPGCNVTGQLTSRHVAIEDGAAFSGRVEMIREESDAVPAEPEYDAVPELEFPHDVEGEAPPLSGKLSTSPDSSLPDLEADEQSETGAEIPLLREEP